MEDEYVKSSTQPFMVKSADGQEPQLFVVKSSTGEPEPFMVTVLENFTDAVKACEALNKKQQESVLEFIKDNLEVVKDGLARWVEDSDRISQAHSYVQEIFPNLPELLDMAGTLTDILIHLPL